MYPITTMGGIGDAAPTAPPVPPASSLGFLESHGIRPNSALLLGAALGLTAGWYLARRGRR